MNPEEAVQAMADCGAELAVAHHFGTFPLADDAYDAPPQALAEARAAAGISGGQFRTMKPGEVWDL